jgi:hypothetical protein
MVYNVEVVVIALLRDTVKEAWNARILKKIPCLIVKTVHRCNPLTLRIFLSHNPGTIERGGLAIKPKKSGYGKRGAGPRGSPLTYSSPVHGYF